MEQLQYLYSYQLYMKDKSNTNNSGGGNSKECYQEISNEYNNSNNLKKKTNKNMSDISDENPLISRNNKTLEESNSQSKNYYSKNSNSNRLGENNQNEKLMSQEVNKLDKININSNSCKKVESEKSSFNTNSLDNGSCKICNRPKAGKLMLYKCYSDFCTNIFCQDCFSRNNYQTRAASCKCSYFDCESCSRKKICIMSTIFCNSCEKRICHQCYTLQHQTHGSVKIFPLKGNE